MVAASLGLLVIGLIIWSSLGPEFLDEPPYPSPNGYGGLVLAGHKMVGEAPGPNSDYQKASAASLETWLKANHESLAIAAEALKYKSRMVLPRSLAQAPVQMNRLNDLRQLCQLLGARARLDELEGRTADAVKDCLDVVRVAQEGTLGGVMIDVVTGFACESYGLSVLTRLRENLTAGECEQVVQALEATNAQREPVARVVGRDHRMWSTDKNIFARTAFQWSPGGSALWRSSIAGFESSRFRADARLRLLIAELAIRRYRLEKGSNPPSLAALVGEYLAAVPVDPYTDQPLRYRLTTGGHQLYSIGPDDKDDGGRPFPEASDWTTATGDVLVDPA